MKQHLLYAQKALTSDATRTSRSVNPTSIGDPFLAQTIWSLWSLWITARPQVPCNCFTASTTAVSKLQPWSRCWEGGWQIGRIKERFYRFLYFLKIVLSSSNSPIRLNSISLRSRYRFWIQCSSASSLPLKQRSLWSFHYAPGWCDSCSRYGDGHSRRFSHRELPWKRVVQKQGEIKENRIWKRSVKVKKSLGNRYYMQMQLKADKLFVYIGTSATLSSNTIECGILNQFTAKKWNKWKCWNNHQCIFQSLQRSEVATVCVCICPVYTVL